MWKQKYYKRVTNYYKMVTSFYAKCTKQKVTKVLQKSIQEVTNCYKMVTSFCAKCTKQKVTIRLQKGYKMGGIGNYKTVTKWWQFGYKKLQKGNIVKHAPFAWADTREGCGEGVCIFIQNWCIYIHSHSARDLEGSSISLLLVRCL